MHRTVLVIGSLGLDRLLSVPRYPQADSKVRTTAYHEYGGGNSGNTASTMAKLKSAKCWSSSDPTIDCINIKLLTKVGDDIIGHQLKEELENVGVDCSSSLFCVVPNTATSFTTIIVSEEEHTRTCLHTHGTSGELTLQDVQSANLDEIFENVIHLHTDSRHTEAALAIAQEARKRGIPISIDVEKNRYSKAQDQLLELATIVFTNSYQIDDYLNYLCREKEQEARTSLQNSTATLVHPSLKDSAYTPIVKDTLIQAIQPSFYFARWQSQTSGKEVVITKGKLGAVHVQCHCYQEGKRVEDHEWDKLKMTDDDERDKDGYAYPIQVNQDITIQQQTGSHSTRQAKANYKIHTSGVLRKANIVDTTGAGDAFIGAYILSQLCSATDDNSRNGSEDTGEDTNRSIQFSLDFASWVAGKKLGGPGGRVAVPSGEDIDHELGTDLATVRSNLLAALSSFGGG